MLTIRLQRVGRKNDPSFRVVVVESKRKPQTGNYLEMVGSYDARTDRVSLKNDRIKHWIGMGATVSDTVHNILVNEKVIDGKKINVLPRKSPPKKDEPQGNDASASAPAAVAVADVADTDVGSEAQPEAAGETSSDSSATAGASDAGAGADGGASA